MKITEKQVEHVARLSRLSLTEAEKELFTEQLNQMVQLAGKLQELNTEGIKPTVMGMPKTNVMREDERRPSSPREKVLSCASDSKDGFFRVPAIFED